MSDEAKTIDKSTLDQHSEYELVMIASREARRLNEVARANGKEIKRRVTEVAWERLLEGKIHYVYGEPPVDAEETLDEAVAAAVEAAAAEDVSEGVSSGEAPAEDAGDVESTEEKVES